MQSGGLGDQIFFQYVLGRGDFNAYVPKRKKPKELPVFLSTEEVKRLFDVMTNPKHKTLLMTAYGTGMRVSELVRLRIVDLDCSRQMLRVNQGKGQKDRFTILPLTLIDQLEAYRKAYQPQDYFFYSRDGKTPITIATAQKVYYQAIRKAGIIKKCGIHILRHSFATHLLDSGWDIFTIKALLGHRSLSTTAKYIHVMTPINRVRSPLDVLFDDQKKDFMKT